MKNCIKNNRTILKIVFGIILLVLGICLCSLCVLLSKVLYLLLGCLFLILGITIAQTDKEVTSEPIFYAMMVLIAAPLLIALVIIMIKNPNFWFTDLLKDNWVSIFGSCITYLGTIVLGFVTLLQNRNLSNINKNLMQQDLKIKVYPKEEIEFFALDNKVLKIYFNRSNDFLSYIFLDSFCIFKLDDKEKPIPDSKIELAELYNRKIMFIKNDIASSNCQPLENYMLVSNLSPKTINEINKIRNEKISVSLQYRIYNCFGVYSEYSGEINLVPQTDSRYGNFSYRVKVYRSLISLIEINIEK